MTIYSTFLGGTSTDRGNGIVVDTSGNAYVTGLTASTDFPTQNPYQATRAGYGDAFITKLSSTGDSLIYSTYLGGSDNQSGLGIAVDASGNAYVTGYTGSSDFPTRNPYQGDFGGGVWDVFMTKLSSTGESVIYSTFLGGNDLDRGHGIAVDSSGNAYVTGYTGSSNFPTQDPYQATRAGVYDAFTTKLSSTGKSLIYSTFLGGNYSQSGDGIAVDSSGNAYVIGSTGSPDFPTQNPYQGSYGGGDRDAFITKLSSTGKSLAYSTYLGGDNWDIGQGIAVDSSGNAYVTGETWSSDFPTDNPYQGTRSGDRDAFITKLSPTGSSLISSTYLGGSSEDHSQGIAIDASGNTYVTGSTNSTDFPTRNPYQGSLGGLWSAFVTKLSETTLPTVTTNAAINIGQTSATLNATVNPNGSNTTAYYDYGLTTNYGSSVTYGNIGSGTTEVSLPMSISGLQSDTTYHFRARAAHSGGTTNGNDQTFTTDANECVLSENGTPLPDTGQTQSYTSTFGEDSDYIINPPSYTKLDADGNDLPDSATSWAMVRDNVTHLVWEVKTDDGSIHDKGNQYTWQNAQDLFVAELNSTGFGGHSDWRMPTIQELSSITDLGRHVPAINTDYFPNTLSSYYWSSNAYAYDTAYLWRVRFYSGHVNSSRNSYAYYVRAVRGGETASSEHLVTNGDGTVTDTKTGLMWQQGTSGLLTWETAISQCEALSLAGYDDWRLPNRRELRSIVDFSRYDPAIDIAFFPDTLTSPYWSSTTISHYADFAWDVDFISGGGINHHKSYRYYARAVRGGQPRSLNHLVILSPSQGSTWQVGNSMPIKWETQDIPGEVEISISWQGGKSGTFETIDVGTENDGCYVWTVSGICSVNCVLRIIPLSDPDKETNQGLFSIKTTVAVPTVTTAPVSYITINSASGGGNVTSDGCANVTARGVCWSTSENPTIEDSHTSDGAGPGSFESYIAGLSPGTTYHIRAYATNKAGTGYGDDIAYAVTVVYVSPDGMCHGNTPCFSTVQEAVEAVSSGVTIKVAQGDYHEFVRLESPKELTLECGWDTAYSTQSSTASINHMRVESGKLAVGKLIIRTPQPDDFLALGLAALSKREILKAHGYFESAFLGYGSQASNNADAARFFYALTRVAALWFDMDSDGDSDSGLNNIGDILDAFGCSSDGRNPWEFEASDLCPETLPSTSPNGEDLQTFLHNVVRPELEEAIQNLENVSPTFNKTWTEPFDSTTVESDYGDVLFFRAIAKGLLAVILIQQEYDLKMDIASAVNDETLTMEAFLEDHPGLLTLGDEGTLPTAKDLLHKGLDDIDNAIDWIQAETDAQSDDFINLEDITSKEISDAKDQIADAKAALDGQHTLHGEETPEDTRDDTIIDISQVFSGIDLRALLPPVVEDDLSGFLPDSTIGGMLVKLEGKDPGDLNRDLNGDGTADIFENSVYYVYGGNDISSDSSSDKSNISANPEGYGFTFLGVSRSPDGSRDFDGAYSYYLTKGRSLFEAASINAFELLGHGSYCCLSSWDKIDGWSWEYSGPPDFWDVALNYEHYILLSAPLGTTGIRVYGVP